MNREQLNDILFPLRTFRLSLNSINSNKNEVFEKQTKKYPIKTSNICLEKKIISSKNQLRIPEIFEKKKSLNIQSSNKLNKVLNNENGFSFSSLYSSNIYKVVVKKLIKKKYTKILILLHPIHTKMKKSLFFRLHQ